MELVSEKQILDRVRSHRHGAAKDFKNKFFEPSEYLFDQVIEHPENFSYSERKEIYQMYKLAKDVSSKFDMLGYDFKMQLMVRDSLVDMTSNCQTILDSYCSRLDLKLPKYVMDSLAIAASAKKEIKNILQSIEYEIDNNPEPIVLRKVLKEYFSKQSFQGNEVPIQFTYSMIGFADTKVFLNEKAFIEHVLKNILSNLRMHASSKEEYKSTKEKTKSNISILVRRLFAKIRNLLHKSRENDVEEENKTLEPLINKVHIKLEGETIDNKEYVQLTISNNGKPFTGDINKVFNENFTTGNGGTGFGMYEMKKYIEEIKGTIKMVTHTNEKYPVELIITLPIYE